MLRDARAVRRWALALLAFAAPGPAVAADLPLSLYCARGAGDYPDAEIRRGDDAAYVVHVTFVGYRPSRVRADWSLRDCLNTALKYDASRDIAARLWYRERGTRQHELIQPAGMVYKAATRTVVVEDAGPGSKPPGP